MNRGAGNASAVRSGILLDGKLEPTSPKDARLLKGVLQAMQLAKRPSEQIPADEIEAQMTRLMIALFASTLSRKEAERNRKPKLKRFRIPIQLR